MTSLVSRRLPLWGALGCPIAIAIIAMTGVGPTHPLDPASESAWLTEAVLQLAEMLNGRLLLPIWITLNPSVSLAILAYFVAYSLSDYFRTDAFGTRVFYILLVWYLVCCNIAFLRLFH